MMETLSNKHIYRIARWLGASLLLCLIMTQTAYAATVTLHPSGLASNPGGYSVTGTWAGDLDSNDGDSSYASRCCTGPSVQFWVDMDDPAGLDGATINSITFHAYARNTSSTHSIDIGYQTDGATTVWEGSSSLAPSGSYTLISSSTYTTDSAGGALDLTDINNLQIAVDRIGTGPSAMRVTEVYVTVNWTDGTAPDAVSDLATGTTTASSVQLNWTAPGDDGSTGTATSYDIRYSTSPITAGNWDSATQATGEPAPSVAGTSESFTVTGLSASTTYYFAIKTSDEIPNTSTISNVPSATTDAPDVTAPADVSDLGIGTATSSSIQLTWTAPGDDGSTGTATTYDIRYRTDVAITDGNWATATQATGEPSPSVAGSSESFTVTGLSSGTTYYFAIKTADEKPNWSGVSNSPSGSTPSPTSVTLHPSGSNASDNVSYTGGTDATALDTNDGNTSYGSSSGTANDFYLDIDDTAQTGTIDSVIVKAVAADGGGWSADPNFRIGVKTNGSEYFDATQTQAATSYATHSGDTYTTNPQTTAAWTWDEINSLVAIVDHNNSSNPLRVTELYVEVNYTPDTVPPSAVSDLATNNPTSTSIALTWTAPGNDGIIGTAESYDIRYSTSAITEGNWASATQATGEPTPSASGSDESFTVTGLSSGTTYYFAIKSSDGTNTSAISNVPSEATSAADSTAPASVTLSAGSPGENSVQLTWTAPGDDANSGTATTYDVRYSTSAINDGNWASATQVTGEPTPQIAGSSEYFTVTGLTASTTYYFAIKTSDEVPNTSTISNSPSATTTADSGALTLHPSGSNASDNVTYTGGTGATALDSNDGNTSYGSSSGSANDFYLDIDDTAQTGTIDSVIVKAVAADGGGWSASPNFNIGLKTNGSNYFDAGHTQGSTTYATFSGSTYTTNPQSTAAWTWSEINSLVGIVDHTNTSNPLRVTELYVLVNYTPGDTTAPDAVSDLATGTLTDTSVQLSWTAPGDDGSTGTASVYDIRYSTSPINDANWQFASQASSEPTPSVASTSESFTLTGLSPGTTYYFAIKTRDEVPNISALSNVVNATTYDPPIGGYTADNVIPAAQVSQATDSTGIITINWKGRDNQSDNVTLNTFEYSVDGGSTWNAPTNADASASLSTNWDDNGGSNWSTDTTFGAATAHSFTFNTKHADVSGLDGVDQSDVQVRFTLNDGTMDSASPATSESFQVDNVIPTTTITSGFYDYSTDTLTITGTNFTTIAAASTDIKTYVDWTKFVWDINGDDATTANITFVEGDVTSLTVTNDTTLTLVFTGAKGTAIEATAGYGSTGGADTLDVSAGFSQDVVGNAATTDAVADGTLTVNTAPIGGYTADNVIPAAQVTQSTDGNGIMTINWKAVDEHSDGITLNTFEYSVDGGSTWNAPTNADASASLSANWNDNGSSWSSAADFGSAAAHSFTFNTKHADVSGLDGVDQSDVQIRFTLNDGTVDSASPATSESFQVDNLSPTSTITSASYDSATDTMVITGTNFTTIADAATDIKSYVDWTKFSWDVNGDDATTANISVAEADVTSLVITNATTLTLVFTTAKANAIEATAGVGIDGGADTLDITAGFSKDVYGNASTTDGLADGTFTIDSNQFNVTKIADTADGNCTLADCSLREAITAANADASATPASPHIINIPADASPYAITLTGIDANNATGDFDVKEDIKLVGAGAASTTISGQAGGGDWVFQLAAGYTVTMEGMTITNNGNDSGQTTGGCVYSDSNLTVKDTTFNTCKAARGGAILVSSGYTLTIDNSTFTSNTTTDKGGAIRAYGITIQNGATFTDNYATNLGGAIYNDTNDITINGNTLFDNNDTSQGAADRGGAIYTTTNLTLNDTSGTTTFQNNDAYCGGAINVDNSAKTLTAYGTTFTSNTTNNHGGALCVYGGNLTDVTFTNNSTTNYGGAIYSLTNDLTLNGTNDFTNNDTAKLASDNGGAIYATGNVSINATSGSTTFLNNDAYCGGAININASAKLLTAKNSTFTTNTAANIGGALCINGGTLTDVSFTSNNATNQGGAIYSINNALTINGTSNTFASNSSTSDVGGAISSPSGAVDVTNTTFNLNTAAGNGGAISANNGSSCCTVTATDSTFTNNQATAGNGGAINARSGITLTDTTLDNNTASGSGGSAFTAAGAATLTRVTISNNTATTGDGGGIWTSQGVNAYNSTISDNAANGGSSLGGGIYTDGTGGTCSYTNTTFYNNSANSNGSSLRAGEACTIKNVLMTSNGTAKNCRYNTHTVTTSKEYHSTQAASCGFGALDTGLNIDTLKDNGGKTKTHALFTGSSAIDNGDLTTCTNSPISNLDQRGETRDTGDSKCDIGAYEGSVAMPTVAISGTVYTDEGTTTIADGATVRLIINGASAGTDTTSSGAYSITASPSAGDAMIVYIDGHASDGTTVTVSDGNALAGLNIYADHLITRHDNGGSLTNANMTTALGAYSDAEILYTTDGSDNLTVGGSATELYVWTGDTYAPGATIDTVHMDIVGTLDAAANAVNVSGNWDVDAAGVFTSTGTVTFDAASGTNTITPGGTDANHDFQNIIFNDAAGTATFQLAGAIDIDGDFTVTDGIFDTSGSNYAVTVGGNFSQPGGQIVGNASTFTVAGNFEADGTDSGTGFNSASLVINGSGSTIIYNNLSSWWTDGFNNLTVGQSGVTDTLSTWLAVKTMLTIGTGELTGASTLALTAAGTSTTFDAASNLSVDTLMFIKFGGGQNIVPLTNGYDSDISIAGGSALTVTQTGAITINSGSNLIITGDGNASRELTYDTGSFDLTVGGNITIGNDADSAQKTFNGSNSTITVGGNFSLKDGGTPAAVFTSTGSTVILNGVNQSIDGNITFNNLSKTEASDDATDSILTFTAGDTFTVAGTLTLDGLDADDRINLVSATPSSTFALTVTGAKGTLDYLDVTDSDASGSTVAKPLDPANSVNSGNNTDWFRLPIITVTKMSIVISDPASSSNPKRIPGAIIEYMISPSNSGDASPDANSTYVTDVIDSVNVMFDVTTGVSFTDGTTSSALSLDTITYSDDAAPGPYVYDYTPVPDGDGYDSNITSIKITTTGTFANGGAPSPSFTLKYRVKVQ